MEEEKYPKIHAVPREFSFFLQLRRGMRSEHFGAHSNITTGV